MTDPSSYAAPEILAKDIALAESDYYTMGIIMYEMMTQKVNNLIILGNICVYDRI